MDITAVIQALEQDGVIIDNEEECTKALSHYGLFRLMPYRKLMDDHPHFSEIMKMYDFDREMRIQIGLLMEMLEMDIKTKMVEETADINRRADNLSGQYIKDTIEMEKLLSEIIEKHKEKIESYTNPSPTRKTTNFWKVIWVCSFGDIGLIFKYLNDLKKVDIVNHYHLPMKKSIQTFSSWLSALRKVRNMWAHHEICMNNRSYLRISPRAGVNGSSSLFVHLEVILFLCMQINREKTAIIRKSIVALIERGARDLEYDILGIIRAPQERKTILNTI